jgi:hypothetical protein
LTRPGASTSRGPFGKTTAPRPSKFDGPRDLVFRTTTIAIDPQGSTRPGRERPQLQRSLGKYKRKRQPDQVVGGKMPADVSVRSTSGDIDGPVATAPPAVKRMALRLTSPDAGPDIKPVFIGDHVRHSNLTSAQFLSDDLLACGSFDGRRIDLVSINNDSGTLQRLHSAPGTYRGRRVQNDLLGASASGEFFATSNFHSGSSTLYSHDGQKIFHVRDFPNRLTGYVHGVRFYNDRVLALTACSGPMGVHFFDVESGAHLLGIKIARKCQDVVFLSPTRMLVLAVTGHPQFMSFPIYDSEIWVVDFDLKTGKHEIRGGRRFSKTHYDAGVIHEGTLFITDQYNNRVQMIDIETLERVGSFGGYNFPHGLDIRNGVMAVTNYGTSTLTIDKLPAPLPRRATRGVAPEHLKQQPATPMLGGPNPASEVVATVREREKVPA